MFQNRIFLYVFRKGSTIGKAVKQVIVRAVEQERVHFGIFQCVDMLDR